MAVHQAVYHTGNRGLTQPLHTTPKHPETEDEKRRRLHREAVAAIKHHKAALKEARERYHEYDQAMSEDKTDEK